MAISNLGNGTGKIYITDSSGNIISNLTNNADGKKTILADALTNSALASETSSFYTSTNQRKYYLYANSAAAEGSTSGATEITNYIVNIGFNNRLPYSSVSVSSGIVTYTRSSSIQRIIVDTQSDATTDDVLFIRETNSLISDGDIIIIVGEAITKVSKFCDRESDYAEEAYGGTALSGVGQMELDNNAPFNTYDNNHTLMLMYSTTTTRWHEINRTPSAVTTIKNLRDSDINIAEKGARIIETASGGDIIDTIAGSTEGVTLITGTHSLGSGNYTVEKPSGGTPKEGDRFTILWNAALTTSGAVNVFGKTLTASQASSGATNAMEITSTYANGAWQDGLISRNDAAAEDALGNPTSDGMILSSTAAGVRSWTSLGDSVVVKKFSYDFSVSAGDVGTITPVAADVGGIPKGAIIDASKCYIQCETALASSGSATLKIGITCSATSAGYQATDDDFFLAQTNYNASPLAAEGTVAAGASNVGMLKDTATPTWTIGTAALTAGKIHLHVAYYPAQ
tara:strand:- start:1731 stop:3269 length:1539 start_codon:yes stop_codon:yes gene_type:complete